MSVLPKLYVEGSDDLSVISALLKRHGVDTKQGADHLQIQKLNSVEELLGNMVNSIRVATNYTVGFVLDIDINVVDRWRAVRDRLKTIGGIEVPEECPENGYFAKSPGYKKRFGVWLMPDCRSHNQYLEDLCITLIPNHPLWDFATKCTKDAAALYDAAVAADSEKYLGCKKRFKNIHERKAFIHTWLAWQDEPGTQLGAAVNSKLLNHDSPQAIEFLHWLKNLYEFAAIKV